MFKTKKFTNLRLTGYRCHTRFREMSQNDCECFRIRNSNLEIGSQFEGLRLKRHGQSPRQHISQTITLWLMIIPFPFPHFIISLSKSSSINQSICRVTPPCWKSVTFWLQMERDNVEFHKAWHLWPGYKLQCCQCQDKKLACVLVASWPQPPTARNCIQNPVLQFTGNSQERSSMYLKLQWAYHPGITPRCFHTPEFFQADQTLQRKNSCFWGASM